MKETKDVPAVLGIEMDVKTVNLIATIACLIVVATIILKFAGRDMWAWVPDLTKKSTAAAA